MEKYLCCRSTKNQQIDHDMTIMEHPRNKIWAVIHATSTRKTLIPAIKNTKLPVFLGHEHRNNLSRYNT
jgi:hypothetical protein